jgi:multidrug efflux pump subunit AcrA (membrane-fusion protein)
MSVRRWILLAVVLGVLVIGAGYLGFRSSQPEESTVIDAPPVAPVERGDVQKTVTAPGKLVNTGEVVLSMGASGRLAELNVRPGDRVKAGDALAAIDTTSLELEVAGAEQAYLKQQLTYSSTVQPDPKKVAAAQAALSSADAAYQAARQKLERGQDQITVSCFNVGASESAMQAARDAYDAVKVDFQDRHYQVVQQRKAMLETTTNIYEAELAQCNLAKNSAGDESGVQSALAQVMEARKKLNELTSPSDVTVLAARADLEQARLAVEEARRQLAGAILTAPFDGVVLEVKAVLGDPVSANAGLILLADTSAVEIEATVIEEDYPLVQAGQPVELYFDVRPDAAVTGRVDRIVPQRTEDNRPLYPVYVAPDGLPEGLLPGMTVDASIVIDSREKVLRLPQSAIRVRSDGTAQVEVWLGDHSETRTVKAGLIGDRYVEILEGLREGEQVVGE